MLGHKHNISHSIRTLVSRAKPTTQRCSARSLPFHTATLGDFAMSQQRQKAAELDICHAMTRYGNYGDMFIKLLKDKEDETWDVYFVFERDSPPDDVLAKYECLVLTGSSADSFKDPDWNKQLQARLAAAVKRQQRILGLCYGHQIMARVLGGETGRASLFEGGPRTIDVTPAFFDQWFVKPSGLSQANPEDWKFNIHETHSDVVTSMPPDVTVIASSDKTRCEGMVYKDQFLGLQGHPEFTADFQTALIEYRLQHNTLTKEQAEETRKALQDNPVTKADFTKVQKMLKYFVKGC